MKARIDHSLTTKIFSSVKRLQQVHFSNQSLAPKHETFLKNVANENIFQNNLDGSSGQLSNNESFLSVTVHKNEVFR